MKCWMPRKPKLGDDYWRVDYKNFNFFSAEWTWKNSTYEIDAYNNGYVFRTDEEYWGCIPCGIVGVKAWCKLSDIEPYNEETK